MNDIWHSLTIGSIPNFFFLITDKQSFFGKNSCEGIEQNNLLALLKPLRVISNKFIRYLVFVQILYTTSIENGYGWKREFKL